MFAKQRPTLPYRSFLPHDRDELVGQAWVGVLGRHDRPDLLWYLQWWIRLRSFAFYGIEMIHRIDTTAGWQCLLFIEILCTETKKVPPSSVGNCNSLHLDDQGPACTGQTFQRSICQPIIPNLHQQLNEKIHIFLMFEWT